MLTFDTKCGIFLTISLLSSEEWPNQLLLKMRWAPSGAFLISGTFSYDSHHIPYNLQYEVTFCIIPPIDCEDNQDREEKERFSMSILHVLVLAPRDSSGLVRRLRVALGARDDVKIHPVRSLEEVEREASKWSVAVTVLRVYELQKVERWGSKRRGRLGEIIYLAYTRLPVVVASDAAHSTFPLVRFAQRELPSLPQTNIRRKRKAD
jgi:hypothetical protein